jgi:thioredoxin 1
MRPILERVGNSNRRPTVYPPVLTETERTDMAAAVTETTFEEEVLKSETPVIVDFWAEWCGPCHAVAPVLDRIVEERSGEVKLVKVNIDEEQELARRYGIMSIPTMILFKDGEPAAVAIGAQPKGAIEQSLGLAA